MIKQIRLENFRGFRHIELSDLGNVIVNGLKKLRKNFFSHA